MPPLDGVTRTMSAQRSPAHSHKDGERARRAFLFLVNPRLHYDPYPDWQAWMPRIDEGETIPMEWNTGSRRSGMTDGDVALLVKLGQDPRGLVATGVITSDIYEGPHWNPDARSPVTGWVQLRFDRLFDLDDPVPLDVLRAIGPSVRWTARMSGTEVPIDVAREVLSFVDTGSRT
ncbi:MAG: hypothetical protein Q3979_07910 [Actinomycetaceae bacterium]|nr:hypothetical protein [Actinomycetaceae bacterium]